jgi:hypothetical protein
VLYMLNISDLVFASLAVTSFSIKMACAPQLFNIRSRPLYENGTINTKRCMQRLRYVTQILDGRSHEHRH